jgi:hypothetical protein
MEMELSRKWNDEFKDKTQINWLNELRKGKVISSFRTFN